MKSPARGIAASLTSIPRRHLRKFSSFEHIEDPEERAGKEMIQYLQFLSATYPDYSRLLTDVIEEIEFELTPRPAEGRNRVIAALGRGECTISEIQAWTGLSNRQVTRLLRELIKARMVRKGILDDEAHTGIYILIGDIPSSVSP